MWRAARALISWCYTTLGGASSPDKVSNNVNNINDLKFYYYIRGNLKNAIIGWNSDIEQVLREKKSFTLRCILDRLKELQGRVGPWNRFASSVSITSACSLL